MKSISKKQLAKYLLSYHQLYGTKVKKSKEDALDLIKKIQCIQYDPINIVGRNADLVLQSRIKNYRTSYLYELLYKDRKLIDGWDKMMSIYSIEDWPNFERYRSNSEGSYVGSNKKEVLKLVPKIEKRIIENGPLSSLDFSESERVEWWFSKTKLTRIALEYMFFSGKLTIFDRVNTRKIYDISANHIPKNIFRKSDPNKKENNFADWYHLRKIKSTGTVYSKTCSSWIGKYKSAERNDSLKRLLEKKLISEIFIEDLNQPFYIPSSENKYFKETIESRKTSSRCSIIAPLDNLMWDRKLVEELFNFEYRWEVYKPVEKRKYGYYVLPILYGDKFIARFEPGKDVTTKSFIIKNWWWEEDFEANEKAEKSIVKCFKEFLGFLKLKDIQISKDICKNKKLGFLTNIL